MAAGTSHRIEPGSAIRCRQRVSQAQMPAALRGLLAHARRNPKPTAADDGGDFAGNSLFGRPLGQFGSLPRLPWRSDAEASHWAGCAWTATTPDSLATITGVTPGTGDGTVSWLGGLDVGVGAGQVGPIVGRSAGGAPAGQSVAFARIVRLARGYRLLISKSVLA